MTFLDALILTLPAFAANMAPVIAAKIWPKLNLPVDFHSGLFGPNKTWRGLLFGTLCGGILGLISYGFWLGMFAGFIALCGDLLGSSIKRKLGILSGKPMVIIDQIDYLLPFILLSTLWIDWTLPSAAFILACGLIGNPTINFIARRLKLRA